MTSETKSTPRVDVYLTSDDLRTALRSDAGRGLRSTPKDIPPKWFYDTRGSQLFDDITRLPEYYPTRCERAILVEHASEIAAVTRADTLVELGSGTSDKTRILLDALARRRHDQSLRAVRRERADTAGGGRRGARRVPVIGRPRRCRRLRAPPRVDPGRRAEARGLPRRDDRQSAPGDTAPTSSWKSRRDSGTTTVCCSGSTSSRTSTGSRPRTTTRKA